jgi:hypothetical protein
VKSFLALDLSIRSTGFAWWKEGLAQPVCGTWELAPHIKYAARAFVRLHRRLLDLHDNNQIDDIVFEEAVPAHKLHGNSNAVTIAAAAGLAAHVMSFGEAIGANWRPVSIGAWRRHFIGSMPRGTKTPEWKHLAMTRCREFGIEVLRHDAAEAFGMLDYQLSIEGIIPPWRQANILQRQMRPATEGAKAA